MSGKPDHRYPRDYSDRQLLESIWFRIDGLAKMVAPKPEPAPEPTACTTCGHTRDEHRCLYDGCCGECACTGYASNDLRTRLVQAALDAIEDDDPLLIIGVGSDELRLTWAAHDIGDDHHDRQSQERKTVPVVAHEITPSTDSAPSSANRQEV